MKSSASSHLFFIGTYTKTSSRGIYAARLDDATGALSTPELAATTDSPTFLAFSPGRKVLYAVRNSPETVAAFAVEADTGRLAPPSPAPAPQAVSPCHIAVDRTGRALITTNYHTGMVATLPLDAAGTPGAPRVFFHRGHGADAKSQATPHPHSATISPDNRFVIVCDLGLDRIFTYNLDLPHAALAPAEGAPFAAAAPGSGPRHFTFGANGRQAYSIQELGNTIVVYDYDAARGALEPRQTLSTLPPGFSGKSAAAEVSLHPNGKFLYGSNRGHDSLASFAIDPATGLLAPLAIVPCGGRNPRHFAFSPGGKWLVCAHQDTDTLCTFAVDPATGRLTRAGNTVSVGMPVCVLFY